MYKLSGLNGVMKNSNSYKRINYKLYNNLNSTIKELKQDNLLLRNSINELKINLSKAELESKNKKINDVIERFKIGRIL